METSKERYQSNKLSLKIVFNQTRSHIQSNYLFKLSIVNKIKCNQDAIQVLNVLAIDVSKHYNSSFRDSHA